MASVLLAISGVFVSMGSPVSYFDYTSPVPYCLLFISLMFSMIVMLMSGSSVIHWLHANRHWTQEQLKQGNYFVLSYLFVDSHAYILCRFVILKQRAKPLFDTIQRQCEACGEITGRASKNGWPEVRASALR